MKILLIFTFCLMLADTDAVTTVTGYRGRSVQIKCFYESGYENYKKYLCRGKCSTWEHGDIPVESGSPAKDSRFTLNDNKMAKVFTVTITDLRPEDENTYWCGIERNLYDLYTENRLLVKMDDPAISTVSYSTHSHSVQTQTVTPSVHAETTHFIANTLSDVHHQTSTHEIPGVVIYAMIISGAAVFAVGGIIAVYCKTKCQGSETVIQSPRKTSQDYENVLPNLRAREKASLPEPVYKNLDTTTNQSDPVYQNLP